MILNWRLFTHSLLFPDKEGPNKPNSGTNSAHANKAVRMKNRAYTTTEMNKDFPLEHEDEEGPITVREMVTMQRQNVQDICERL